MRKIGRLVRVRRLRAAMCDVAERAAPGAQVTQYHERCRTFAEALSDIRTRRLFANGMQVVFAQDVFDVLEALRVADAYPYPVGLFQALGWNNLYRRSAEGASCLGGARLSVDGISHVKLIAFAAVHANGAPTCCRACLRTRQCRDHAFASLPNRHSRMDRSQRMESNPCRR